MFPLLCPLEDLHIAQGHRYEWKTLVSMLCQPVMPISKSNFDTFYQRLNDHKTDLLTDGKQYFTITGNGQNCYLRLVELP